MGEMKIDLGKSVGDSIQYYVQYDLDIRTVKGSVHLVYYLVSVLRPLIGQMKDALEE